MFLVSVALAVLWAIVRPGIPDDPMSGVIMKAASEAKEVGLAAKLYADDHQGRLPKSLDELSPDYLPKKEVFAHTYFATPRSALAELRPESIMLFRVAIDERRHETRVIIVHPDISVEWKRP